MRLRLTFGMLCIAGTAMVLGCANGGAHNLPPAQRLMEPGPGVGGPGPGVLGPIGQRGGYGPMSSATPTGSAVTQEYLVDDQPNSDGSEIALVQYAEVCGPDGGPMFSGGMATVQTLFAKPDGMQIRYDMSGANMFDSQPIVAPGRQTFGQSAVYRVKLTNIPGREGVELYPTITIAPVTHRTMSYLAHSAIPIQFTEEDFDQVLTGNFVTKVIYLPDPEFQELAVAGVDTLVSTKLDPGVDPVVEADRRGTIMAVVRLGNKDLQFPSGDSGYVDSGYAYGPGEFYGQAAPMGGPGSGLVGSTGGDGMNLNANYISGLTAPVYGMPITGTPIGLPGPPHIPLGAPAGLQSHVMRNRTRMDIPRPVENLDISVRQSPGYSYPRPPSHLRIHEQNIHAAPSYRQPAAYARQILPDGQADSSVFPGMTRRQARLGNNDCEICP